MGISKKRLDRGVILTPDDVGLDGIEGELKVGATSKKLHAYLNGAIRSTVTEDQPATLTYKTIDANGTGNSISNLEVADLAAGVLDTDLTTVAATDTTIPSAKATKTYVDTTVNASSGTVQTNLTNHINNPTDAHDASAISSIPSGNLAATEVQAALNELQTDVDTRATSAALTAHTGNATGAHAASAISNAPLGNLASTTVQGALNELQGDIDTKVSGPASSVDNTLPRFDLTTGKLIQGSGIVVSDVDAVSGVTSITSGNVITSRVERTLQTTDAATTGSNVNITSDNSPQIVLTNASLVSIDTLSNPAEGATISLINQTGNTITINNNTGATATNRILTGTKAPLTLKDEASLLLKYDIVETRWMVIGGTGAGTGSGGINYITNFDAEVDTTGYSRYANTVASASPETGTGGAPNAAFTFTRSTVSPLRDTASFLVTKDAANRQGHGASYPFTIASADQAQILRISFDYSSSTNYADDDMRVYVYDVTNSQLIEVVDRTISASTSGKYVGSFQSSSNSTSFRLIFHVAGVNATAYTLKLDNIVVGPQTLIKGAVNTDNQAYTPTIAGCTAGSVSFKYRQVGDSYHVNGTFEANSPTATTVSFTLPGGATIDTNKLALFGTVAVLEGTGHTTNGVGGAGIYTATVSFKPVAVTSDLTKVFLVMTTGTDAGLIVTGSTVAGTAAFNAGANASISFIVPILGKSSNLTLSEDSGNRLTTFRATRSGTQSLTTSIVTTIQLNSITSDTCAGFNSGTYSYIVPETGYYDISSNIGFASSAVGIREIRLYIGGSGDIYDSRTAISGGIGINITALSRYLVKGTAIYTTGYQDSGSSLNIISADLAVHKVSSPQTLAGSETVAARYATGAGQSISDSVTTIVNFGTKSTFDSHSAVTTGAAWKFTAPQSGKYEVSSRVQFTNGGGWNASEVAETNLYKNGGAVCAMATEYTQTTHSNYVTLVATTTIDLVKGDYIDLRVVQTSGAALALYAFATNNWINIQKIGN